MATIDLRKAQKGASGQKFTPMYPTPNNDNNNVKLENRVEQLENKLDKILNLLENKKDD